MQEKRIRGIYLLRGCIFALAFVFIVLGIARGEVDVVIRKAVRICLECIGVA